MNIAAKVRAEKEAHPERFCWVPSCLWRTQTRAGAKPCQFHPPQGMPIREIDVAATVAAGTEVYVRPPRRTP